MGGAPPENKQDKSKPWGRFATSSDGRYAETAERTRLRRVLQHEQEMKQRVQDAQDASIRQEREAQFRKWKARGWMTLPELALSMGYEYEKLSVTFANTVFQHGKVLKKAFNASWVGQVVPYSTLVKAPKRIRDELKIELVAQMLGRMT
jgi:hypothetical protein